MSLFTTYNAIAMGVDFLYSLLGKVLATLLYPLDVSHSSTLKEFDNATSCLVECLAFFQLKCFHNLKISRGRSQSVELASHQKHTEISGTSLDHRCEPAAFVLVGSTRLTQQKNRAVPGSPITKPENWQLA